MIICRIINVNTYWYLTVLFFVVGVLFSFNEEKIIDLNRKILNILLFIMGMSSFGLFCIQFLFGHAGLGILMDILYEISLAGLVLLITLKIKNKKNALNIIGECSFEIYLTHVMWLNVFDAMNMDFCNIGIALLWGLIAILSGFFIKSLKSFILHKCKL